MTDPTVTVTLGLRFRRSQARLLRDLAERAKVNELPGAVSLFAQAADAARKGEPLIVGGSSVDEIRALADGFTIYGVAAPTVELLDAADVTR